MSLRDSFHIGRIGDWAEMAARAGFISIHYVNVLSPNSLVAPFGGSDARFTTNPYCTAIPKSPNNPMMVLDMATSTIAQGKARVAHLAGKEVPDNCLIDADGNPIDREKMPLKAEMPVQVPDNVTFVTRNLVLNFQGLKFEKAGIYSVDVSVDEELVARLPLRIVQVPQQEGAPKQ